MNTSLRRASIAVSTGAGSLLLSLVLTGQTAEQIFDSGSDGSDGVLVVAPNQGVVDFVQLDVDGDNVYHFTSIQIGAQTTLRLRADRLGGEGKPVIWLAQGDVTIDGIIDLSGGPGSNGDGPFNPSVAGAGGFGGGRGSDGVFLARPGNGPGGGGVPGITSGSGGGFGGGGGGAAGGGIYGNMFLVPLIGGSGGSGGFSANSPCAGGGGGGGALVIASSGLIQVSGGILANGGDSGLRVVAPVPTGFLGGGGSGGAIRLISPSVLGNGSLTALGGSGRPQGQASPAGGNGGVGRIRIEAFRVDSGLSHSPTAEIGSPLSVFPPPAALIPTVQVDAIDGTPISPTSTGSFAVPDIVIASATAVTIDISATNIPPGTILTLNLQPETGTPMTMQTVALAGTLTNSTTTASVAFPSGFSRFFLTASW